MASYNRVILMGNLTRDPETRQAGSSVVCKLGLAVNRRFRDSSGAYRDETTFVDVEVWGRQAETCSQYLKKGSPALVEGRLKMDQWEDKTTGQKRSKLLVSGDRVQFLGSRSDNQGDGGYQQQQQQQPQGDNSQGGYSQQQNYQQAPSPQAPAPPPPPFPAQDAPPPPANGGSTNNAFDVGDDESIDDIPF
jgi:single-strand DNA-binding protein